MTNPGNYNQKLKFYRKAETKSADFRKTAQHEELVRCCWGSVKATGGTETYELQRLTNSVTYDVRTRFQRAIFNDNLTIEYEGRRFEIRSVVDVREEHKELAFTCVEILKSGEKHGRYLEY